MGRGVPKGGSRSWQLLAEGRHELIFWRDIGGLRVGPSQTAATEQPKSGYEIAGRLGGCVTRAGAPRLEGGLPKGGQL